MRKLFFGFAAFGFLGALMVQAQPPGVKGGKGRGGCARKNLQVLDAATFPNSMQTFEEALGGADKGRCNYCHVEDRASDEKTEKLTAHKMIVMVREINERFPDGQQHVSCYTCHRGSTTTGNGSVAPSVRERNGCPGVY